MLGWASIARRQAPPQVRDALGVIERTARAQARLIEDVLDFSRLLSGTFRLELAATDVSADIREALEAVRQTAAERGVGLSFSTVDVRDIAVDGKRIRQAVWNVVSNGIRFTPPGGSVSVAVARQGSRITIRVSDTGEGIDPAFLPHVFEPFRQADSSSTRRHGGLGLGLALVKHLVLAHGGTVAAESEGINRGATFTIELPDQPLPCPGHGAPPPGD